MFSRVDDVRIDSLRPLIPPAILMEELPLSDAQAAFVETARHAVGEVLDSKDDRLAVIVGPCSIHDPVAAIDYAAKLKEVADRLQGDLLVLMRTYFEKPRTTVGWKGLINDPSLDNSFSINRGLRVARGLLRNVIDLGLPTATEFLDPISPQFVADLVCWGAIGARTAESQVHRELASGLSMPVGVKNGTGGSIQVAVDAIRSAASPHHFLSVTKQGLAAIVATRGNPQCHLILRGGHSGPNYSAEAVQAACAQLQKAKLPTKVVIDCSHANSSKDHKRQPIVAADVGQQIAAGNRNIVGVMLESFLVEGTQSLEATPRQYGCSVTDACMGWDTTVAVLEQLAADVRTRRGTGA